MDSNNELKKQEELASWISRQIGGAIAVFVTLVATLGVAGTLNMLAILPQVLFFVILLLAFMAMFAGSVVGVLFLCRKIDQKEAQAYPHARRSRMAIAAAVFAFLFPPLGFLLSIPAFLIVRLRPQQIFGQGVALAGFLFGGFIVTAIGTMWFVTEFVYGGQF